MKPLVTAVLTALFLACSAIGQTTDKKKNPSPKLPPGTKALRNLTYAKIGERELQLDLYLPEKRTGRLPVIVWVHGGAWLGGSRSNVPARVLAQLARGYAVASISYRFSSEAIFPAQIEDCRAAIRWLRANAATYELDADHIGAWGASAGGHLVALLGTAADAREFDKGKYLDQSARVQAVCDFFGPTDFLQMDGPGSKMKHGGPKSPESLLIGGPVAQHKDKVARANPVTYVSKKSAPFLLVHGEKDPLVILGQSKLLRDALIKVGVEVDLLVVLDGGHGGPGFDAPDIVQRIEDFFDRHLKPKK